MLCLSCICSLISNSINRCYMIICAVLCKVQLTSVAQIKRQSYKSLMYALAKKNGDAQLVDSLEATESENDDVIVIE